MTDQMKERILLAVKSESYSFDIGEVQEIKREHQRLFNSSFDHHCGGCLAKALRRIVETF